MLRLLSILLATMFVTDDAAPITYSGAIDFVDGANLSVEYTYDGNGNLTSDANKGISLIEYDDMNMPHRIQFANGNKKKKINEFILCFALVFVPL